ncbi:MAG: TerB family tellurite resistance protein [Proteobacteria bacterium]|nr:TerB family tellurite resistance protein [Pseudomonadota bacterium]
MINLFITLFKSETVQILGTDDARIALAALMVRLARTDGDYAAIEITMIDRILSNRYNLDETATQVLRAAGEELESKAPDTVRFTRIVKEAVPYEERAGIVQALWSVVLADGQHNDDEHGFMRLVANLLGVNDRDSAFARQRAQKTVG